MKNSNLVNAGIIGALFLVFKFIEMRFITKEDIPPKQLIRDGILVFVSVLTGQYLSEQFDTATGSKIIEVFTDNPSSVSYTHLTLPTT